MMDMDLLRRHIESGIVVGQQHPTLPLTIFNYSRRCQYERLWDDVTLQCRGLVMHNGEVIARPFRKFFNDHEHAPEEIPWHLPSEVTEKVDGSLLILFHFQGQWLAATRGSFVSEQSVRGLEIFRAKHGDVVLRPDLTYLFEVIYPANRIVVDYGAREAVVLLGMIETRTRVELPLDEAPTGLEVVRRLPATANAAALRSLIRDDEEGYVVRFSNGFRVKIKGERYMELHRILSGVSSRLVWELLSQGKSFDEMLDVIPDEFGQWVVAERHAQQRAFDDIWLRASVAATNAEALPTRKEQALFIMAHYRDVSSIAFLLLDGKDARAAIWKQLYPAFRRPEKLVAEFA